MPFSPEEIESRHFLLARRGYDPEEVNAFLAVIADEQRQLLHALAEAREQQAPPAPPTWIEESPISGLGPRVESVLRAAAESAAAIQNDARQTAAEIRRTAEVDAARAVEEERRRAQEGLADVQRRRADIEEELVAIRAAVEREAERRVAAAEEVARTLRSQAEHDAAELRAAADRVRAEAEQEAEATRARAADRAAALIEATRGEFDAARQARAAAIREAEETRAAAATPQPSGEEHPQAEDQHDDPQRDPHDHRADRAPEAPLGGIFEPLDQRPADPRAGAPGVDVGDVADEERAGVRVLEDDIGRDTADHGDHYQDE